MVGVENSELRIKKSNHESPTRDTLLYKEMERRCDDPVRTNLHEFSASTPGET